jgi:hypothetical protein
LALPAITSSKPFLRSMAGAEPTVPCSSTMLTLSPFTLSSSHLPALRPSSVKSLPIMVTYRLGSVVSMLRSVSTTGILAALASFSTVSQPVVTTGAKAMTSTFCAMKLRMALIWFSCFCCASLNFRLMPALAAASLMLAVLAVRHSLSAPTWAKPSVSFFCAWAGAARPMAIVAAARATSA